jgi:hypothetical protein
MYIRLLAVVGLAFLAACPSSNSVTGGDGGPRADAATSISDAAIAPPADGGGGGGNDAAEAADATAQEAMDSGAADAAVSGFLFPHIKTFSMGSGMTSPDAAVWMRTHMDMESAGAKVTASSHHYVSWSDSQSDYTPYVSDCLAKGIDVGNSFLHYSKDQQLPLTAADPMTIGKTRAVAMKEDRFSAVYVAGGVEWSQGADAHAGQALSFDGSAAVAASHPLVPAVAGTFTIEAWIKPATQASTAIVGWGTNNGLWIDANGSLVAEVNVDGTRRGCNLRYVFPAWDAWYHVVGVGDAAGGQTLLYVNGTRIGSVNSYSPGAITNLTGSFSVGGVHGLYYKGFVDDVRLYDRALTDQEVSQRFSADALITSGLVLRWSFDSDHGTVVVDDSGNGNNGGLALPNQAANAYGDAKSSSSAFTIDLPFGAKAGDALYLGLPAPFTEATFNLGTPAAGTWAGAWEYWNGASWAALTLSDGTAGMRQSGTLSFAPPADWKHTLVSDYELYWIRLRCTVAGTSPVATAAIDYAETYTWSGVPAVRHQKYPVAGGTMQVVPGWNPANDRNGDGFVDDTEFADLADPGATARLKYRARVPSWYFSNRWVMYLHDPTYLAYIADSSRNTMTSCGCDGVFIDNVATKIPDALWSKGSYLEYADPAGYRPDAVAAVSRIRQGLAGGTTITNGCRSETDCIERIPGRARIRHYAASAKPGCS